MPLLITSHKTPVGTLNLLADDQILIGANLSTVSAFKAGKDVKIVKSIPVISDLVNDYFDGDLTALNGIKVRQPGAPFSQAAWKAMRKIAPGKTWSYSDLAEKAGSPAAVRAAGSACANYQLHELRQGCQLFPLNLSTTRFFLVQSCASLSRQLVKKQLLVGEP